MSETNVIKTFGTVLKDSPVVLSQSLKYNTFQVTDLEVPINFDGRKVWKRFLTTPIRNQGKCGNCWAQAACNMLEDRFLIQSKGKVLLKGDLSATHLTICEYKRDLDYKALRGKPLEQELQALSGHHIAACHGNSLYNAIDFLYRYGVVSSHCINSEMYSKWCTENPKYHCTSLRKYEKDEDLPSCEAILGEDFDLCLDGVTAARRYRAAGIYNVPPDSLSIMREIYKWGTVACGFQVFEDFMEYDGKTIYTHPDKQSKSMGGHATVIVGWGEEMQNNRLVKYWIIENSWSKSWGDGGFCKIEREILELQLEQNVVAVVPDIPYVILKCDPHQAKFLQEAVDDVKRKDFGVNEITGYREITIEKIEKGILMGSLEPLIAYNYVPEFCKFVAGRIEGGAVGELLKIERITGKFILIPIGILVVIALIILIRKLRKNR